MLTSNFPRENSLGERILPKKLYTLLERYKKQSVKAVLDKYFKACIFYIASFILEIIIHLVYRAQIASLLAKKVTILAKFLDFADVFLKDSAKTLLNWIGVNEHVIKFEKDNQLSHRPIYSLELVEFETFKTYIKTTLANGFIKASKSPTNAPIFPICKLNNSVCFCVNYQRLNNLTIKNWYLLPLMNKFLNWLGQAKQFTWLNLTSVYH